MGWLYLALQGLVGVVDEQLLERVDLMMMMMMMVVAER